MDWKSDAARKWDRMSARVLKWALEAQRRGRGDRMVRLHGLATSLSKGAIEHERIVRKANAIRAE